MFRIANVRTSHYPNDARQQKTIGVCSREMNEFLTFVADQDLTLRWYQNTFFFSIDMNACCHPLSFLESVLSPCWYLFTKQFKVCRVVNRCIAKTHSRSSVFDINAFDNARIISLTAGALIAFNSNVSIGGNASFVENTALLGGKKVQ